MFVVSLKRVYWLIGEVAEKKKAAPNIHQSNEQKNDVETT